jgi:hypothetical protein
MDFPFVVIDDLSINKGVVSAITGCYTDTDMARNEVCIWLMFINCVGNIH